MCFSSTASFTASALLLTCSLFTLRKATIKQLMFAAIPALFAIQQFAEGMIWLRLSHNETATVYAYAYALFVFIIWPLWIPLSLKAMGKSKQERKLLRLPVVAGIIVALITLSYFGSAQLTASIIHNHIYYTAPINQSVLSITTILYLFATIAPFFIITMRYALFMGTTLAASYLVSYYFYSCHIISIWCFFAAVLSALTLLIVG